VAEAGIAEIAGEPGELRRFLLEAQSLRGNLVRLGPAWQEMRARRAYPPLVESLLGEAVTAAVLLAATLKFAGTLTLQLAGNGRVRLLVAQCTDDFGFRAVAHHDLADGETVDFPALVGSGQLAVTVASDENGAQYQGIVPLEGSGLANCLEHYFASSEQLPTRLRLAADSDHAGGILLQKLPARAATGEAADAAKQQTWEDLQSGLDSLPRSTLLRADAEHVVRGVLGEHECRLFGVTPVRFACRCSGARVAGLVRALGLDEAHAALRETGALAVTCEFCGREYRYDAVDVEQLFAADAAAPPPPGRVN
jgi:molecular chaperone Hsp33